MDWLAFKFCVLIWILCVSKSQPQLRNSTNISNQLRSACLEGHPVVPLDPCNTCICFSGQVYCSNLSCKEQECNNGTELPQPDQCNECICRLGKVKCTDKICIPAPECTENQVIYPGQNKCNACTCKDGFISCTSNVCVEEPLTTTTTTTKPKKKEKCVEGSRLPGPDQCLDCICQNGKKRCKNVCNPVIENRLQGLSATGVMPIEDCQAGDYIPPPPPPNDCNTCYCIDNHIVCTMNSCEDSIPGFKERLKEKNEKANLDMFDKKVPIEPFINILYTKNDKIPHKLKHSHTYNGFHKEIKVHASHLPKDTNKLLNVLANALDNADLASISQKLLISVPSDQDSQKPFDHSVNHTNQLGEGNVLSPQSSKFITSGSQSNETILVFPHTKPSDDKDSLSVLPLESKHETTWKTASASDTLVHNNGTQILSHHSQEKNGKDYYDKLPAMITPIDLNPIIFNPAKLGPPGQHYGLLTKPAQDTADTPSILTQSIYPTLHPKPIDLNDGKMIYASFSPENIQIKPAPSSFAIANHDDLPHLRPFQSTKPRPNQIINHTSPTSVLRPELNPDNNVGQQKLSQYQFAANPSNFYPNQGTPEQFQSKSKRILSLPINYYNNNKGVPVSPQYLNNPVPPIVIANQYEPPQFGLKPAPGSSYPNNIHLNPAPTNLPYQKNRISTIDNEAPQFEPNSKAHHSDILNPSQNEVKPKHKQPNSPQSQLIPNPSYKYEYEAPKKIEENPDQDQLTPNPIISYEHTEDYDPLHTLSESDFEKLPHKVSNNTKRYNTTHSHYNKHTPVTYVSEYDPNNPVEDSQEFDLTKKVDHYLNIPYLPLDQNEPHLKSIQSYLSLPGQRQNDTLHPTMTDMNKNNQHDSWNLTNKQFEEDSLYPSKSKQIDIKTKLKETYSVSPNIFAIYLHKSSKSQLVSPQDNSKKEGPEDPKHPKSNLLLESKHETASAPDTLVYNNGTQILSHHNEKENSKYYYNKSPLMITPIDSNLIIRNPAKYGVPGQHYRLSIPTQPIYPKLHPNPININYGKMIYAPFSPENKQIQPAPSSFVAYHDKLPHFRPFQTITPRPNQIINHTSPTPVLIPELNPDNNVSQEKLSQYQFAPPEKFQTKPKGILSLPINYYNNKGVLVPLVPKINDHLPPLSQIGLPENQHTPEVFDDQGSNNEFQYTHNAYDDPRQFKPLHNLPHPKLEPNQNQRLPGVSTEDLHYPIKSAKLPFQPKYKNLYKPQISPFRPTPKQHLPGVFDDHGSANSFHYLSNSAKTPFNSKNNLYKPGNSLLLPTQKHSQPGVFDDQGFADGIQYPSNAAEGLKHSKENIQKSLNFPSYLAENPKHPRGNLHNLPPNQFETDKKRLTGVFDDHGPADGFHYPSKSADISLLPKDKLNELFINNVPSENPHEPWRIEDRGSASGLKNPPSSTENSLFPKGMIQHLPHPKLEPNQNQRLPEVFDGRESTNGLHYPTKPDKRPFQPKYNNLYKPQNSPFRLTQKQHLPGVLDDHGPANGLHYPSNSAKTPFNSKNNLNKPSNSLLLPTQKHNQPGVFDDQGFADGIQYLSNAAEGPKHSKENIQKSPNFPSYLAENPKHSRGNLHNLPPNHFGTDKKRLTGVFDDHGSADGFHYPSKSADISLLPKDKLNELFINNVPTENPHEPWRIDDREPASGLKNPPSSTENSLFPQDNIQNLPHPKLEPNQNQRLPEVFDGRGSTDGLHYPTKSTKLPFQPNFNIQYNLQNSPFRPNQKQHLPGVFDDHGSANGLHYPSNSAKTPFNSKNNLFISNSLLLPTQKHNQPGVFDDQGFADGIQYPSNAAEGPKHSKENIQKSPNFLFSHILDKPTQDTFGDRESMGVPQYPFNSADDPKHPKVKTPHFSLGLIKHLPGIFDERGSASGFQYPSHSAQNPLAPKSNQQNPSHPQSGANQNQQLPLMFDECGPDSFQYPSISAENPLQPKGNQQNPSYPELGGPNQKQHMPELFDDGGSADGFHYLSDSAEDPKHPNDNAYTTPKSNFKQSQNQLKPSSLDIWSSETPSNYNDKTKNRPTSNNYNSNDPVRPWIYLDHDQYKPSSFDNLPNGVHNIPWSLPEDDDKVVNTVSSTSRPRFEPDYDQFKTSSFDNLSNGIQHMPKPVPNQDNNALESNDKLTTPKSVFKPKQDQNENINLFDEDDDHLQIDIDNYTNLINSDSMHNNLDHRIKPDNVPDSLLLTCGGKFPDYYDKLYPLFIALKKLSDLSNNHSDLSIMDELELDFVSAMLEIADILNYNPSKEQYDDAPVENQVIQRIFKLTDNDNRLKSKLIKLISTKNNTTETKNEIDLAKIFSWLCKLMRNRVKTSTDNIPFNGFDPEIVEKIMNDFKEDTQTVTPAPRIVETTNDNDNRFYSVSTAIEETQQQDTNKYPEVLKILNQPDHGDDVDIPPYIEANGKAGQASDMHSKEIHSPLFPIMFHLRFRHRPQDQKDECGDGTQWISNCHTCSCYLGQTMCSRMQDCKLRPFGEPMICKPYSHFKMGCYTCECNGDGVAECDATDCGKKSKGKRQDYHKLSLPIYHEFFDNKKTDEILQYYKIYKKLPKTCPRQDSEMEYPTCERGTSWTSSCYKCECNERGKHECTKLNDCVLDFNSYGKPGRCKPNSKFYPRMNSRPCVECLCNDEGIPYCPEADLKKH